jgi:putative hydrolase of the HAD superfamily
MIRVVTFDAAGTLIRLVDPAGHTYARVAAEFGCDCDPERMQAAFGMAWRMLPPPPETPGPHPDDGRGWWRLLVEKTLESAGYRIDRFNDYFAKLYATFSQPGIWELYQDAENVLVRLNSSGIRLGVISNFDGRLRTILRQLDVAGRFEYLVISSEVGAEKPSARIFHEAARRFAVEPDEILHVGDDPEVDIDGARAAGLQALLVDHKKVMLSAALEKIVG